MMLLLGLAVATMGLGDDVQHYNGGWHLFRNETNCALMRTYEDGIEMRIAYSAGPDSALVSVFSPAFKSIVASKKYPLKLLFVNGEAVDAGWGSVDAIGTVLSDAKGVSFRLTGTTFLTDVKKNAVIGLFREDRLVISLKLDNASAAIDGLKACAARVEKENPSDPFADQ